MRNLLLQTTVNGLKPIELNLAENPTTGYRWDFTVEGDVENVTDEYISSRLESEEYRIGGGGIRHLLFQPSSENYCIHLEHLQAWDPNSVSQEFDIKGKEYVA